MTTTLKHTFVFLMLINLIISCKPSKDETKQATDKTLDELFMLMQGSFNSENQSKTDSTYYNISLHMYPIWKDKGNYLYVEQALNNMQDKPYHQRIYEVKRENDSVFSSSIYTIKADSLWIGKWKTPKAFDTLSQEDISLREGCEVLIKRIEKNYFKGKTGEKTCPSNLRGASFATSEVEIFENKIISWDRGFDKDGNYIWGAEKGGYIFDKIK
jgi:hypothetical protein